MGEFGKRRGHQPPLGSRRAGNGAAAAVVAGAVSEEAASPRQTGTNPLYLSSLCLAAVACFSLLIYPYAGGLLRDVRLAGTWQPAYDLQSIEGRCTRHEFVLTTCEVTLRSLADVGAPSIRVNFLLGFVGGGGAPLVPMRSSRDPAAVTVGYAAETELTNRVLTFVATTLGFGLFIVSAVAVLLAGLLRGRQTRHPRGAGSQGSPYPAGMPNAGL